MPINIRFERKDKDGNIYYEDRDGNRIPEPNAEEIAEQEAIRQELIAESNRRFFEIQRKQSPFLLKSLGNLQKPRARKALWIPHPNPLPRGEGVVYWAERELCILAGDGGVGKSLVALQIARQLTLPMQNEGSSLPPSGYSLQEGDILRRTHPAPTFQSGHPTDAAVSTVSPTLGGEFDGAFRTLPQPLPTSREGSDYSANTHPAPTFQSGHPTDAAVSIGNSQEGIKKILYIDWELTEEEFVARWGCDEVPENFFWMGFHADGKMPQHIPDKIDWLLQNFATTVKDTGATILIIDQPDRLYLSPQKWNEFLMKLKAMMRKHDLSVMLVLSNKSRHLGRPCGLNNIPKGNILIPVADSVIMMAQNQRRTCERYFKVLKNRNRASAENLEFVDIIELEELDGYLNIRPWGYQRERDMLPPNAAERKNQRIMEAEKLWNSGLSCLEVGEQMYVAESTVKSWLRPLLNPNYGAKPIPLPKAFGTNSLPRGEGDNTMSPHLSPDPSPKGEGGNTSPALRATPPTLGGEFNPSPNPYPPQPLPKIREGLNSYPVPHEILKQVQDDVGVRDDV